MGMVGVVTCVMICCDVLSMEMGWLLWQDGLGVT